MARKRLMIFGIPAWLAAVGGFLWWRSRGTAAAARLKEQISTDETAPGIDPRELPGSMLPQIPGPDQPVF